MPNLTRRDFLAMGAAAGAIRFLPVSKALAADGILEYRLRAAPANARLAPLPFPETPIWAFNGQTPGPVIRGRQGKPLRIIVENGLNEETTVHWHGLRIANAMDGVPHITQHPIEPGKSFTYEITPPDAGTFWYHPHTHSLVQVSRGLYGPLIIDEPDPIKVDREVIWTVADWRLGTDAAIRDNFDSTRDFMRAGRIGNTVTVNGQVAPKLEVRAHERIRLRLINAAEARICSLRFMGHRPSVIAFDGQPVPPFFPDGGAILLGPSQRADLILDMTGKPGETFSVFDGFYLQQPYELASIVYSEGPALRKAPQNDLIALYPNPVPEPDLSDPVVKEIAIEGGDMGTLSYALVSGERRSKAEMLMMNKMWALNGVANVGMPTQPMFTLERGRTCVINFRNMTVWPHPMHLHGHSFLVLEHDSRQMLGRTLDTVLLGSGESTKVAFVADNPGVWMLHCHILGHADAGMMATIRVL
jgi:FtsP/CotA-like multicopper oxidase with cupredoxin domain